MSFDDYYSPAEDKKFTQAELEKSAALAAQNALEEYKAKAKPKQNTFVFESQEITGIYKDQETDRYTKLLSADERDRKAAELGQVLVFPADDELQIDIDSEHAYDVYKAMLPIVTRHFRVRDIQEKPSKSGLPKRHITIKMSDPVTPYERLILQLALGSDRVRDVLGLARLRLSQDQPTCFFEPKPEVECTTTDTTSPQPTKPSLWSGIKERIGL